MTANRRRRVESVSLTSPRQRSRPTKLGLASVRRPSSVHQPALRRRAHRDRRRAGRPLVRARPEPRPGRRDHSRTWSQHELITSLLYRHLDDVDTVHYRQEVFRDLDDPACIERIRHFADLMRQVREHLAQVHEDAVPLPASGLAPRRGGHLLRSLRSLADDFGSLRLGSRALLAFREFLIAHATSSEFTVLAADTRDRKDALGQIRYCIRVRGGRVEVSRYENQGLQRRGVGYVRTVQARRRQGLPDQLPHVAGDEPRRGADP